MKSKIIDLTHLINEDITVYPDTFQPKFEVQNTIEKDGFSELKMAMCTHTGTHIDAPSHMIMNSKSLDLFPLNKFIGKSIVVPCQGKQEIDLKYLQTFEEKIKRVQFIIFFTGWQEKWNTSYFDDFPTLTKEAAEWLTQFNLDGVCFDAISVDKVTEKNQTNHHILLSKEILIIENLTNVDQLPENIFSFHCIPLKIEHADGSPVRAFAIVNE
jgi:arylformamidase